MINEDTDRCFLGVSFLLAGTAYPATNLLLTPFKDDEIVSHRQIKFNKLYSKGKIVVENTFALLKTRFKRLQKFTEKTNLKELNRIITSVHNFE